MCEVSIIVPIYNGQDFIEKCVDMILKQTFTEFELILVNDGSKDNSEKICKRLALEDNRIKVLNKQNGGAWSARNFGINYSIGKYIMFLDCDDSYDKNLIKEMYINIQNADLVICGQTDMLIDKKGVKYKTITPQERYYNNKEEFLKDYIKLREEHIGATLWNKMYKRNIINKFDIKFKDFKRGEDVIFNLEYFEKVNSCRIINKALYFYRIDTCNPWWIRYKDSLYSVLLDENQALIQKLTEWDIYDDYAIKSISSHFIKGIIGYFNLICDSRNDFKIKEQCTKILDILAKPKVQQDLEKCSVTRRFEKIIVRCMKNNNVLLIILFLKIKFLLKRNFKF